MRERKERERESEKERDHQRERQLGGVSLSISRFLSSSQGCLGGGLSFYLGLWVVGLWSILPFGCIRGCVVVSITVVGYGSVSGFLSLSLFLFLSVKVRVVG